MNKIALLLVVFVLGLPDFCAAAEYRNLPMTKELVTSGIKIVDIRTAPEWRETGIVPGSRLLTFYRPDRSYDLEAFIATLGPNLDPHKELAILCRSGNRSAKLAELMADRGFTRIINLLGGIRSAAANGVKLVPYPGTD